MILIFAIAYYLAKNLVELPFTLFNLFVIEGALQKRSNETGAGFFKRFLIQSVLVILFLCPLFMLAAWILKASGDRVYLTLPLASALCLLIFSIAIPLFIKPRFTKSVTWAEYRKENEEDKECLELIDNVTTTVKKLGLTEDRLKCMKVSAQTKNANASATVYWL